MVQAFINSNVLIMIEVFNVSKHFGGIRAVDNVNLKIKKGSITGLIGPNGAGKTTLFNVIAGVYKPTSGKVFLDKKEITNLEPHQLFKKGLLRTFQISQEFSSLTVIENLMMVPENQSGEKILNSWFNKTKVYKEEEKIKKKAEEILKFLQLSHLSNEYAGNLSGGQKKLLELGRTMMVKPKIVFLDEVGAGVNKTLLKKISSSILKLNKEFEFTFCMIEHDMDLITELCNPVIVMSEGKILTEGEPKEIVNNENVIEAYLGKGQKEKN